MSRNFHKFFAVAVAIGGLFGVAYAGTVPNYPSGGPVQSGDIEYIVRNGSSMYGTVGLGTSSVPGLLECGSGVSCAGGIISLSSSSGITALTGDVTASGSGSVAATLANTSTARADLGLGSAATVNTGTAGATLGLLNGSNTYSGANIFTAVTKHDLNAASLTAPLTGTILQLGNTDTTVGRVELDAYGAAGHYTVAGFGGTAASPTALAGSTTVPSGSFNFFGYNGTSLVGPQAAVRVYPTQNWTVGSNGTQLDFAVTPNGSSTLTQAMLISQDGGITLGTPTGGDKGSGTINAAGGLWSNGAQLQNGVLTAGTNITITGSWPNQTINATTSGGGSGTVNSGTATALAYYGTSGTAVSGASALGVSATTGGLNIGGVNGHSLPDNGADTTGVSVGSNAYLAATTTGEHGTAVGANALSTDTTGTDNTAVGYNAGAVIVSDQYITAVGSGALAAENIGTTTTASGNTAMGYFAGHGLVTGTSNVFIGNLAGNASGTATGDVLVGASAAVTTSSNTNAVAIGFFASAGNSDIAIGDAAKGADSTGISGVSIGYHAGSAGCPQCTTIGYDALDNATGAANVALGPQAGTKITTGSSNIVIGPAVATTTLTTGGSNILIGTSSAIDATTSGESNLLNIQKAIMATTTVPTISSGFGSSPSVVSGASSEVFTVNVGTGGSATSGVVAFADAMPNGYACDVADSSSVSTLVTASVPTSSTTVTWTSYSRTTGTSTAWNASDILVAKCAGY